MKVKTSMEDREWVLSLTVFSSIEYKILNMFVVLTSKQLVLTRGASQYSTELK